MHLYQLHTYLKEKKKTFFFNTTGDDDKIRKVTNLMCLFFSTQSPEFLRGLSEIFYFLWKKANYASMLQTRFHQNHTTV